MLNKCLCSKKPRDTYELKDIHSILSLVSALLQEYSVICRTPSTVSCYSFFFFKERDRETSIIITLQGLTDTHVSFILLALPCPAFSVIRNSSFICRQLDLTQKLNMYYSHILHRRHDYFLKLNECILINASSSFSGQAWTIMLLD